MASTWYVYLARCADQTLYCGIAVDVAARVEMHNAGTGAKYTRPRRPIVVQLVRRCRDKGTALRLEYALKQLTRADKEALIAAPSRLTAIVRRLARATSAARRSRTRAAAAGGGARTARAPGRAPGRVRSAR